MLRPDEVDDRDFGFSVQLSAGPGMSLLVVLLLVLQDLTSWPLGASISPHRAAFATLYMGIPTQLVGSLKKCPNMFRWIVTFS